jgi:chemotaxis protein MotB
LLYVLTALALGCVPRGRYMDVVHERDNLDRQNERLLERVETVQRRQSAMVDVALGLETEIALLEGERALLQREQGELAEELAGLAGGGRIEMKLLEDGLHLVLAEELVFDAGSAELHASGREVLSRIVGELEELPYQIAVLGHTDAAPIGDDLASRYPSNWELAAARASSVVRLLESRGIPSERLLVVSFGPTRPLASNDTPTNRARNRRVDLRLRPVRR